MEANKPDLLSIFSRQAGFRSGLGWSLHILWEKTIINVFMNNPIGISDCIEVVPKQKESLDIYRIPLLPVSR